MRATHTRKRPSHPVAPRATFVRGRGKAFGSHHGPRTAIGPTSWRTLPIKNKKSQPMVGSGKGAAFVSRNGVGAQTVKRSGPVIY